MTVVDTGLTETVWEPRLADQRPRLFSGAPVFTDMVTVGEGADWQNAKTKTTTRWAVCLYVDEEEPEDRVTANVVGFPGVVSDGVTEEEAIKNVREALGLALASLEADECIEAELPYAIPMGGRIVFVTA
jgi:predicted RNase H-like HicB family nuclease